MNGQKIRLQILYGSATDWTEGDLSQLTPKVGELCADYDNAQLKIGDGKNTWSGLNIVGDISYYSNTGHIWAMTDNQAVYRIPHADNNENHALNLTIPVGTGSTALAKGNHTHANLHSSQVFRLNAGTSSCSLQFWTQTQALAMIQAKPSSTIIRVERGTTPTSYSFDSKPKGGNYTVATIEEVLPMPEIQFLEFTLLPNTVTTSEGDEVRQYRLKFRVTKGTIQQNDYIELCAMTLSTSKSHPGRRRYRMRSQWQSDISQESVNIAGNVYTFIINEQQLKPCYKFAITKSSPYAIFRRAYPVYLRVRRQIDTEKYLFSPSIQLQLNRRAAYGQELNYGKYIYSMR